jgi:hypothetical protein
MSASARASIIPAALFCAAPSLAIAQELERWHKIIVSAGIKAR